MALFALLANSKTLNDLSAKGIYLKSVLIFCKQNVLFNCGSPFFALNVNWHLSINISLGSGSDPGIIGGPTLISDCVYAPKYFSRRQVCHLGILNNGLGMVQPERFTCDGKWPRRYRARNAVPEICKTHLTIKKQPSLRLFLPVLLASMAIFSLAWRIDLTRVNSLPNLLKRSGGKESFFFTRTIGEVYGDLDDFCDLVSDHHFNEAFPLL
ncbi:hypothetical protein EGR_10856 [Echinococcus granulosus]|uniref:Uncharacterized protein n=1 Tax=Echinococcus granulosus TaxID=6210 RepID=W6TZV6_ECHGR|nr:hypothetical protein EGR_10856 [Echinococcus granulosus]EUB54283.1 hypothetical protein EGR_10856 [Echinococcus granulosus]